RGISGQHLFRIDYEDVSKISSNYEKQLLLLIKKKIPEVDAIILSDYDKGTLTEKLVKGVISLANVHGKLITADCKPANMNFYKGIDLLKPNKKEAIEMTGENNLEEAGKILSKKLNSIIVITRGSEGMSIFEKGSKSFHMYTKTQYVYDISGAGDTVLAIITLALVSGKSLREAVKIANIGAGIVIGKLGVATITLEELQNGKRWN
ncbi:MAG: PfkB family carbohydrate kinase, partial [Nanoarchaeota archaeon]